MFVLGLVAGLYGWNQTKQDAQRHDENQQVLIYDMGILLDNQKQIVENQKVFMKNGTLSDLRDINMNIAEDYSQLPVNPATGQP